MAFIGGRKNAQARQVYGSIALFAYYEAVPDKPSFEEISIMNQETFISAMHGGLIRKSTCAHGSSCDYWIVGDQSAYLAKHPLQKGKARYLYHK